MKVWKEFRFEAAHSLPHLPEGHKCKRVHGHSYKIVVTVDGRVDEATGMVVDYAEIDRVVRPMIEAMDHTNLNDLDGLRISTSEYLARWVYERVMVSLPQLASVAVYETPTCGSECSRNDFE